MPSIDLESFKGALFDICRPNRFQVSIQGLETDFGFSDDDYYFVKGASLPGKTIGEIELNWQGQKYKVLGDPSFADVTITFWNNVADGGESVRDKFENWFETSSDDVANVRGKHGKYKATVTIDQLDGDGNPVKGYNLIFAHPKELSDIELSMDSTDAVEEFTVVFSYSYLEITEGGAGSGGLGSTAGGSGAAGIFGGGSGNAAGSAASFGGALNSIAGGLKSINSVVRGAGKIINSTTSLAKGVKGLKKGAKGLFR